MQTNENVSQSPATRKLDEPIRTLDLRHEVEEAWGQLSEVHAGHTARTLFKQSMHRAVLLVIKKGAHIPDHKADGEGSLYVLSGKVTVDADEGKRELSAGNFVGLGFAMRREIKAHEDSALLLTLSQIR
jgi:quercetin dioxygenase-like cupin family protein